MLFESGDPLALPQLVGEGHEHRLQLLLVAPRSMRPCMAGDPLGDTALEQQSVTRALVLAAASVHLVGMQRLAGVVERSPHEHLDPVEAIDTGCDEPITELGAGLGHQLMVPHEVGRGAELDQERESGFDRSKMHLA